MVFPHIFFECVRSPHQKVPPPRALSESNKRMVCVFYHFVCGEKKEEIIENVLCENMVVKDSEYA